MGEEDWLNIKQTWGGFGGVMELVYGVPCSWGHNLGFVKTPKNCV